jgi:hypothetical protein
MRTVFVAVISTLALGGCYTAGKQVSAEAANQFTPGITTEADVEKSLGAPESIARKSDGTRIVTYSSIHARVKATTYIPLVQLFASGANVHGESTTFVFGPDGKLVRFTSTQSDTDSHNYVGGSSSRTKTSTVE